MEDGEGREEREVEGSSEEAEDAFDEVSCLEEEVKQISFLSVHLL